MREQWRDVLLGIEEEGIPFVLQPQTGGDLPSRLAGGAAFAAAGGHRLRPGTAHRALQNLPASTPLFSLMYHQQAGPAKHWQQWLVSSGIPMGSQCLIHRRTQYE
jgi:hypothetical protein